MSYPDPRQPRLTPGRGRSARITAAAVLLVVAALAVLIAARQSAGPSQAAYLAKNPELDPGSALSMRPAPGFTLTDEAGRPVSLSQFHGRVVLLAFNDALCTTISPLTTAAMLDAKRALGAAGSQVQLLGVDANPDATSVADVRSYTEVHGMLGAWHFLTGPRRELARIWHAYGIEDEIVAGQIDHTPALFVIDPQGRLRRVYLTQQSYAAVPQLGEELAREAAGLLRRRPVAAAEVSYAPISGIGPAQAATLPRAGGGRVRIGPGSPRLFVFFATWDRQLAPLGRELVGLNGYARMAARERLPGVSAIDEGSVEPSPATLPAFLRTLSGPLAYPVAIDSSGRVADGYEVQGEPWFVLVSAAGRIAWYDSSGWPTVTGLVRQVRAALARAPAAPTGARRVLAALAGSPARLAAIHVQSSQLLGGAAALRSRLRTLRGYPIVLNAWASWCPACKAEFGLLASAAARYGRRVAFLGVDTQDTSPQDALAFLRGHFVSYPSYQVPSEASLQAIWPPGINGLPDTLFIDPGGHVAHVHIGEYASQGSLDADVQAYALDG